MAACLGSKRTGNFFEISGNRNSLLQFRAAKVCLIFLRPYRERRLQIPATQVEQFLGTAFRKSQGWIGDQHGPCFCIGDRADSVTRGPSTSACRPSISNPAPCRSWLAPCVGPVPMRGSGAALFRDGVPRLFPPSWMAARHQERYPNRDWASPPFREPAPPQQSNRSAKTTVFRAGDR